MPGVETSQDRGDTAGRGGACGGRASRACLRRPRPCASCSSWCAPSGPRRTATTRRRGPRCSAARPRPWPCRCRSTATPCCRSNDLFKFIAVEGTSAYESSTQTARVVACSSRATARILGPNLVCGTFGGTFPPEFKPILDLCLQYKYPLTVLRRRAQPGRPDHRRRSSSASPPIPCPGNAVRATAHAAPDGATTDAAIEDLRVLGLPVFGPVLPVVPGLTLDTSVVKVDSGDGRTDQRIVDGGLVVDATTTLSGVQLVGGLVRIGSIRSESHVTDDARRQAHRRARTSRSAASPSPASRSQITEDGLVARLAVGWPRADRPAAPDAGERAAPGPGREGHGPRGARRTPSGRRRGGQRRRPAHRARPRPSAACPTSPARSATSTPTAPTSASIQLGQSGARGAAFAFDPDAPVPTDGGVHRPRRRRRRLRRRLRRRPAARAVALRAHRREPRPGRHRRSARSIADLFERPPRPRSTSPSPSPSSGCASPPASPCPPASPGPVVT